MCPNKNLSNLSFNTSIDEIKSYRYPVLRETKDCTYVEYYAFNPAVQKLCRKRIKINIIKGTRARRKYANELIIRLADKLSRGWNPFICSSAVHDLKLIDDALNDYEKYITVMYNGGDFRKQTYDGYKSFLKILREYIAEPEHHIYYAYQMDSRYLSDFLDEIHIVRKNSARTRNNYLIFLKVLCNFMKSRSWIKECPTDSISKISSRLIKKEREIIPSEIVKQIAEWTRENDPWFLLACYLLYYCFIRPQELCRIKIFSINFESHILTITSDDSKNKMSQSITLPQHIIDYMYELNLPSYPSNYHIFSKDLKPGVKEQNPVIFRHHWGDMRQVLRFSDKYKFYSLKDTGITELADNNVSNISIRDQARHSSLAITDIYTRHASGRANSELENYSGSL